MTVLFIGSVAGGGAQACFAMASLALFLVKPTKREIDGQEGGRDIRLAEVNGVTEGMIGAKDFNHQRGKNDQ